MSLISKEATLDAMCELMHHWFGGNLKDEIREIKRELEKLPSAERVGKWIEIENKWGGLEIRCSECGAQVPRDVWGNTMQSAYCPNCGARMTEGEENGLWDI